MHTTRAAIACAAAYIYYSGLSAVLVDGPGMFGNSYGGHYQFLTILGVAVSLGQACVSLLGELSQIYTLQVLGDLLLQISAPVEVLISILYWGIKLIDENLVVDPRATVRLAPSVDRQLHLWPAILQTLAALVSVRQWRANKVQPLLGFGALTSFYWWWVHKTFSHNGFYPYPLLAVLNFPQKLLLFAFAGVLVYSTYISLQAVQRRFR